MFNRQAKITVGGIAVQPDEGLRMAFEIDKHDGMTLNHALIRVYNIRPSTRAAMAKAFHADTPFSGKHIVVTFKTGYEGEPLTEMITGDVFTIVHQRVGPDWITDIDLFAGLRDANLAISSVSFGAVTPAKKIITDLLKPLNLTVEFTNEASQILQGENVSSYSASNLTLNAVTEFLKRYRLGFTIENNGKGLVYKKNTARNTNAVILNRNTGLLGTPRVTINGVIIKTLLRPEIKILERFKVESETINQSLQNNPGLSNEYLAKVITHVGDTRGDDWFTEIEGYYAALEQGVYAGSA